MKESMMHPFFYRQKYGFTKNPYNNCYQYALLVIMPVDTLHWQENNKGRHYNHLNILKHLHLHLPAE